MRRENGILVEQTTQIDDPRRQVSEILRRVDRLIKAGDVEESLREIMRAKEIYPKHAYIGAYEERLAYLKREHEKNAEIERTRKDAEEAARRRDDEIRKEHEKERRRLEEAQRLREASEQQERSSPSKTPGRGGVQIYSESSPKSGHEVILVIDDDEEMRSMLTHALSAEGFGIKALERSDDAYLLLRDWTPSLILCDVNLETSTMGGFSFYEKVRSLDFLHDVPFVFLTGMNDDVMVRTAKELGADDYLMKPISIENLISTIKGKLKRFGSFRGKS